MWKVWYDDRGPFSSNDGPPELAPKRGVQAVVVSDKAHGRAVCRSSDFYIWSVYDGEESWQGVDIFGLWDYLAAPGTKVVLFGRTIGNREYAEVLNRVTSDPELPPKTAWHSEERRD